MNNVIEALKTLLLMSTSEHRSSAVSKLQHIKVNSTE